MSPRPFHLCDCGAHAWVELTKGYVALISPEDRPKVEGRFWHAKTRNDRRAVYARSSDTTPMHQVILGRSDAEPDHINRNGLDNQRGNLRPSTSAQNKYNARKRKVSISPYKGVTLDRERGKWRARIVIDGRQISLGYFDTQEQAGGAYQAAQMAAIKFQPSLAEA